MKKNGLVIPYLIFARDTVRPERVITSGKRGTKRKGYRDYQIYLRPHNIKYKKITSELEEIILDLRLSKRFGCNRIKFRLRKVVGISLTTALSTRC